MGFFPRVKTRDCPSFQLSAGSLRSARLRQNCAYSPSYNFEFLLSFLAPSHSIISAFSISPFAKLSTLGIERFGPKMASPEGEIRCDDRPDTEKVSDSIHESSSLLLSEEQALARARSCPDEALPILITYGFNDHDYPRNWPKLRKWYITCLVSMLNVFTSVG